MDNTYLALKSLHVLGAVLFLGNIIVTGWWKFMADRTRDPRVIAFAQRQVTLTDLVFTAGGAALLLGAGWGNAALHGMDLGAMRWLAWGFGLFLASGAIWVAILIPIQIKQAGMAKLFANGGVISDDYWRLTRLWNGFGALATILPLINIYWMVFKPS
jgi:uncharacterized membrane protein